MLVQEGVQRLQWRLSRGLHAVAIGDQNHILVRPEPVLVDPCAQLLMGFRKTRDTALDSCSLFSAVKIPEPRPNPLLQGKMRGNLRWLTVLLRSVHALVGSFLPGVMERLLQLLRHEAADLRMPLPWLGRERLTGRLP